MENRQVWWERNNAKCVGTFLAWGIDYEELGAFPDISVGHFSAAIIERPNGEVELIPATKINFIKSAPTTGDGV